MSIAILTTAVVSAFSAEHAAQAQTDSALRDLFVAHATFGESAAEALRQSKAGSQNLSAAERKARCIPGSAAQVTGAWFVGSVIGAYDDDTFGTGWVRDAWDMASAVANEAKYGGGKAALSDILASDALSVSEALARLEKADAKVKSARRKAAAEERKAAKGSSDSSGSEGSSEESSDSESVLTLSDRLAALVGPINAVRDMMATVQASDADKAQAQALIDALSSVLAPATVVTIPDTVASILEPVNA